MENVVGKKLPHTPNSRIKSALRVLWMRSRERAAVLKRDNGTCQKCHQKASNARGKEFKVEVHHLDGIENWDEIYRTVRKHLLVDPSGMQTLCKKCHKKEGE